jgi:hypothetical protein
MNCQRKSNISSISRAEKRKEPETEDSWEGGELTALEHKVSLLGKAKQPRGKGTVNINGNEWRCLEMEELEFGHTFGRVVG